MKKKLVLALAGVAVLALMVASSSFAAVSLTPPTLNVDAYAEGIFTGITSNLADILVAAGVITGVAVGFGLLRRWVGHRKATRI